MVIEAAGALGRLRHPGALWLDLRWASAAVAVALLAALGGAMIAGVASAGRTAGAWATAIVGVHAARDAVRCAPQTGPASLSAVLALGCLWLLVAHAITPRRPARCARSLAALGAGVAFAAIALPLAQIAGSSTVDYARRADAVVVLGARVYADGSPSLALADRVSTGCDLWKAGLAPKLVLSGGPGDGQFHETETMRRLAIEQGVDPAAIVVDRDGWSTADTARNVSLLLRPGSRRAPRVLVVSHDYHLARARLAMSDEGVTALTVPAKQSRWLPRKPYFIAREAIAFWVYAL